MNNDEKIRKALESEEIPKELEPENVKKMLDEKAPQAKRRGISMKITAMNKIIGLSAACAVIVGSAVSYANYSKNSKLSNKTTQRGNVKIAGTAKESVKAEDKSADSAADETEPENESSDYIQLVKTGNYMSGAENYEQIYTLYKKSAESNSRKDTAYTDGAITNGDAITEEAADDAEYLDMDAADSGADYSFSAAENSVQSAEAAEAPMASGGMGAGTNSDDSEFVIIPETEDEPDGSDDIDDNNKNANVPKADSSDEAETNDEETEQENEGSDDEKTDNNDDSDDSEDYSDTYNQEENVLEADIMKTDGKYIYYVHNEYDDNYNPASKVNIAGVDKGHFTSSSQLDLNIAVESIFDENYDTSTYVQDMYLYNDMLAVIGTVYAHPTYKDNYDYYWWDYHEMTFAAFYTTGENPQLIDTYYQDGYYNDVRIAPDGYMYLITNYNSVSFNDIEDSENISRYIPECGLSDEVECISADCILLPEEFDDFYSLSYTVIGSLDLNNSGSISNIDSKSLMNYTGNVYCSGDNLYVTVGWEDTDITRIAIGQGNINPAASGTVEGRVNDQFSMSEYNGYFRIAATNDEYEEVFHKYSDDPWYSYEDYVRYDGEQGYYYQELVKRDNRVYVLDLDLNIVGSVGDFGIDESIKSVNFSGDMAYVVTYEQTDPLFAIDLSDPTNPTILDEFKILGYSTYMQKWIDGLLLGFGVDADEDGRENGVKLTMFDNSDPYNLQAVDTYSINRDVNADEWIWSDGTWERKALLIAPEKNIIGIPVERESYYFSDNYSEDSWEITCEYMFFSFDDNKFNLKGEIFGENYSNYETDGFNRALYIGDYLYILSQGKFVSADIDTITEVDTVRF